MIVLEAKRGGALNYLYIIDKMSAKGAEHRNIFI